MQRAFSFVVFLILAAMIMCGGSPALGQQGDATKNKEVSSRELSELVTLMEDKEKREAFVKDLRALILAQDAAREKEEAAAGEKRGVVPAIKKAFGRFGAVLDRIVRGAKKSGSWVLALPKNMAQARKFLFQPENRAKVFNLALDLAAAVLLALIAGLALKRYLPEIPETREGMGKRLASGLRGWLVPLAPYAVLLASAFVFFRVLRTFGAAETVFFLLFLVIFLYKAVVGLLKALLSPEVENLRILSIDDERANYLWVWAKRFAGYTAFYFLATRSLVALNAASAPYSFVKSVLVLVFPTMITVFALQLARELQSGKSPAQEGEKGRGGYLKNTLNITLRMWPIPVIVLAWAVSGFVIFQYEGGFKYLFSAMVWTAGVVLVLLTLFWLLDQMFSRLFALNEKVKERFPGLEEKTNRYIRATKVFLKVVLGLVALGVAVQAWGAPVASFVASSAGTSVILSALAIAVTVGVAIAVIETSQFVSDRMLEEKEGVELSKKRKTLVPLVNTTVKVVVIFIGGIVVLDQLGVNVTPILAGAGIIGLAVGFGAQSLVKDVINGLFILFEDSVSVGDVAVVGDKGGIVEKVGLRTLKIRDLQGSLHVIPNSSIPVMTNMTKDYGRYVFDVGVAYREDVDEVMEILKEIGREMREDPEFGPDILDDLEIFGLDRFEDSAVVVRARFTTKPIRQWAVGREFNRRMKKVFDERGIEIPFPHRTLYMGEPKSGVAPTLQIHVQKEAPASGEAPKDVLGDQTRED